MINNHVVIMAGGIGSRFWPLSTPEYPKQFIDILGCGKSLIQLTADRFEGVCPKENFWVVTNEAYVDIVKKQLPNIPKRHILAEPEARNTAPCIAWACWNIHQECPNANIVITPSDTVIMNPVELKRVIMNSLSFTKNNDIIMIIGIKPSRPEIGYGYIELANLVKNEIYQVQSFKEKPNLETAKSYLKRGNFLWNAGIFVWNVNTIMNSIRQYKVDLASKMDKINDTGKVKELFPTCEKVSIDYAVMELASADGKVYTHPADFGWSDLGNWASLYDQLPKDKNGNSAVGNVAFYDCNHCVVHAKNVKKIVIQGLDNYIISENDSSILICKRNEEQRIKEFSVCGINSWN